LKPSLAAEATAATALIDVTASQGVLASPGTIVQIIEGAFELSRKQLLVEDEPGKDLDDTTYDQLCKMTLRNLVTMCGATEHATFSWALQVYSEHSEWWEGKEQYDLWIDEALPEGADRRVRWDLSQTIPNVFFRLQQHPIKDGNGNIIDHHTFLLPGKTTFAHEIVSRAAALDVEHNKDDRRIFEQLVVAAATKPRVELRDYLHEWDKSHGDDAPLAKLTGFKRLFNTVDSDTSQRFECTEFKVVCPDRKWATRIERILAALVEFSLAEGEEHAGSGRDPSRGGKQ